MASFDSAPNSLFAFNVLERHRLDFDPFRGSYFVQLGGQYAFTEAPNGHLTSVFPIGAALVAFPLYAAAFGVDRMRGVLPPALTSPAFEAQRQIDEKRIAATLAALSVGLFWEIACLEGTLLQAGIATGTYAFATPMWTIGSQALWQHGPLNLCLLMMVYALLRAVRAHGRRCAALFGLAGSCAGFLPVIRPTAMIFTAAALWYVARYTGRRGRPAMLGVLAGLAPGVAWNLYFFHSVVGGYAVNVHSFTAVPSAVAANLAGLLISPSRGLFVFCPVLLFALYGAVREARLAQPASRLFVALGAAAALTLVAYSCYTQWWGGFTYGPRFATDTVAVAALLLIAASRGWTAREGGGTLPAPVLGAMFLGALTWSVGAQYVGANSGAAGAEWNAVPVSIDQQPRRLWEMRDNQIIRNALALYAKDLAWQRTRGPAYTQGLAARIGPIAPRLESAYAGAAIPFSAVVHNDGRSRQYGFASGVYIGQLRVRVCISRAGGNSPSVQFLYLDRSPRSAQDARAVGVIRMPNEAGVYRLAFAPVALGLGPIRLRNAPQLIVRVR